MSEINGKVSLEGGGTGVVGCAPAIGIAQGSIAAPLGHSFGLQVDGLAATGYNSFGGGGVAHLFWRDPGLGLVGPMVALAGSRGSTLGWYGGEAEFYAGVFTMGAHGSYQDAGASGVLRSGGFYHGRITVCP